MKKHFLILIFISLVYLLSAQIDSDKISVDDPIVRWPDKLPLFQGCENENKPDLQINCEMGKIEDFFFENLKYPAEAIEKSIEGKLFVSTVIEKDGSISNIQIEEGIGGGCDEEAVRILKLMPHFIPAEKEGKLVRVSKKFIFTFELAFALPPGGRVYSLSEEKPFFPGCENIVDLAKKKKCSDENMLQFIYENLQYPAKAKENGIEGMVVVSFIVEKDGTVTYPKISRDLGTGLGDEALRIVNLMPKWEPGMDKGEAVRCKYNLPIRFLIDDVGVKNMLNKEGKQSKKKQ